jgi:hypothetical protein
MTSEKVKGHTPGRELLADTIRSLTSVQRRAINGSIFITGDWVLTTEFEDHLDIIEDLSEALADCTSGILTPLGCQVRAAISRATGAA